MILKNKFFCEWLQKAYPEVWESVKETANAEKTAEGAMSPGVPTNWNPFSSNFHLYNTQWFAHRGAPIVGKGSVFARHRDTDKQIDARNQRLWERNPDFDTNVPVNRGSTVQRNGQPINIAGLTHRQRRAVMDTFDASHRSGEDKGLPLPRVRGHYWPEKGGSKLLGTYQLFGMPPGSGIGKNTITLSPKPIGVRTLQGVTMHEMGHWRDYQRKFSLSVLHGLIRHLGYGVSPTIRSTAEAIADVEALRLNRLIHPESRMPDTEKRELRLRALRNISAVNAGK